MTGGYIYDKLNSDIEIGWLFYVIILVIIPILANARIIEVGPSKSYKKPSAAAKVAKDGDHIQIDMAIYENDVAIWRQNNLFIYGENGRPHIRVNGVTAEGKGIWVIKGNNTKIANIEFSGARVRDKNGAGIRQEGANLKVFGCYFHDNENGILAGENPKSEIVIERSVFSNNGAGDGQSHNIYIGRVHRFILQFCYVHHALIGHNVKSRAMENYILYNRLMDETSGSSSYIVDLPNGGTSFLIGNIIQQGPNAENYIVISYAAEGSENVTKGFYLVNNTLVNDRGSGIYLRNMSKSTSAKIINNIFYGPNYKVLEGSGQTMNNLILKKRKVMTILNKKPGFVNDAIYDYRLMSNSPAINAGIQPGNVNGFSLLPKWHYIHIARKEKRKIVNKIDIGAYEFY